jgi:hypothetical protein
LNVIAVDWAEVTAIATSVLAVGLVGAIAAAVLAAQQVREARLSREAQMAAEFFRRWNEDSLVETRRLVGRGPTLIDRWEMWKPAIEQAHGSRVYPLFEELVEKMRRALGEPVAAPDV